VVPYYESPTHVAHGAAEETSQPVESTSNLASTVPQKRIRDITMPEPNDSTGQGFGSSQKKKRKKNQKGDKTIT